MLRVASVHPITSTQEKESVFIDHPMTERPIALKSAAATGYAAVALEWQVDPLSQCYFSYTIL
jgi:hypothetical protein